MSKPGEYGNPLQKFKLVFLGEQSGECYSWLYLSEKAYFSEYVQRDP